MTLEGTSGLNRIDIGAANLTRREVLARGGAAGSLAAMAIFFDGRSLTPSQAKAESVPLTNLTAEQGTLLETVGEVLLPGARDAGIANFVDVQLGRQDPLLIVKYFDWPGPLKDFYTQGLVALDKASQAANGAPFAKATPEQQTAVIGTFLRGKVAGWDGPPPALFYLAVRGDAVDVVYGTVEGFQRLGIPYMPHILPEERW
jgi:gluconate 2-dehydrogenase subunit 3-like protein